MEAMSYCGDRYSRKDRLATLSNEVQLMIMQNLPARDVAKLSSVNHHLRDMVEKYHAELRDRICQHELARLQRTVNHLDYATLWKPEDHTALGPHFIACLVEFDRHYRIYGADESISKSCNIARRRDDFRIFAEYFMRACGFDTYIALHKVGQSFLWRLAEVLCDYQRALANETQGVLRALEEQDFDFFLWAFNEFRSMGAENWPSTLEHFFMVIDLQDEMPFGQYSKPRPPVVLSMDQFSRFADWHLDGSLERDRKPSRKLSFPECEQLEYVVQDANLLPYATRENHTGYCPPLRKTLYFAAVLEETELWHEDAWKMYEKHHQIEVIRDRIGQWRVTSYPKFEIRGGRS